VESFLKKLVAKFTEGVVLPLIPVGSVANNDSTERIINTTKTYLNLPT
jgi:hypothetical protein